MKTTETVIERIRTITGLAGCPCNPERVHAVMLARGTYTPGSPYVNLAALWEAVDAAEKIACAHRAISSHMEACALQSTACAECERLTAQLETALEESERSPAPSVSVRKGV